MRLEFKRSFDRSFDQLSESQQRATIEAIERLRVVYETRQMLPGLGLRLIHPERRIWEIRVGIALRIAFRIQGDLIEFGFAGTHDQLRRYLRDL